MKRVLSFILSVIMVVSCFAVTSFAADPAVDAVISQINAIGDVKYYDAGESSTYSGIICNNNESDTSDERGWFEWADCGSWGNRVDWQYKITYVIGEFDVQEKSAIGISTMKDYSMFYSFQKGCFVVLASGTTKYDPSATVAAQSEPYVLAPGGVYEIAWIMRNGGCGVTVNGVEVLNFSVASGIHDFNWIACTVEYCTVGLVDFEIKNLVDGTILADGLLKDAQKGAVDSGSHRWGNPNLNGRPYGGFGWAAERGEGESGSFVKGDFDGATVLDSNFAIAVAESAYAALTDDQKAQVSNYETLTAARLAYDTARVADVDIIAKIDAVAAEFSVDAYFEAAGIYENLTDTQKALVTNYDKLTEALNTYNALRAAEVDTIITDTIASVGNMSAEDSIEMVEAAKAAYAALDDVQKALVTKYQDFVTFTGAPYDSLVSVDKVDKAIESLKGLDTEDDTVIGGNVLNFYMTDKDDVADGKSDNALFRTEAPGYIWDEGIFTYDFSVDFKVNELWGVETSYYDNDCDPNAGSPYIAVHTFSGRVVGIDFEHQVAFVTDENGDGRFNFDVDPENKDKFKTEKIDIDPGVWYNFQVTFEGRKAIIYINGEDVMTYDFGSGFGYGWPWSNRLDFIAHNIDATFDNLMWYDRFDEYAWVSLATDENGNYIFEKMNDANSYFSQDVVAETTIGAENQKHIFDVFAQYMQLSEAEKALVDADNVARLIETVAEYGIVVTDPAVEDVKAAIGAIGEITSVDQKADLDAIKAQYDALTDSQKEKVDTAKLDAAYATIADLEVVAPLIATIAGFEGLTEDDVTEEITEAVNAAVAEYEALTDAQKAFVNNSDVLYKAYDLVNVKVILGDLDGDGEVGNKDAALLIRAAAGFTDTGIVEGSVIDLDNDGEVGNKDIALLLRFIAGLIEEL